MSSSYSREPLTGLIHQENRVVGAICLPEEFCAEFIEEFNYCYGPMRLWIEPIDTGTVRKLAASTCVRPVGSGFRRLPPRQTPDSSSTGQPFDRDHR